MIIIFEFKWLCETMYGPCRRQQHKQKSDNGKSMGWKGLFSNEGDTNEFLFLSNGCAEALNFPHLPLSSTSAPPPNVGIILKCK